VRAVPETFAAFLRLGLTSFGGPIAHLGYFHREFVERRRWMGAAEFADTVALCQFLPGPTSSQVGFAIGLRRAGIAGGLAAWTAFTLPSAIAMGAAGWLLASSADVHGAWWMAVLRAVAAAVVAHAIVAMVRTLAPTSGRRMLAASVTLALVAAGHAELPDWATAFLQPAAIAVGAAVGMAALVPPAASTPVATDDRAERMRAFHLTPGAPVAALVAAVAILGAATVAAPGPPILAASAACARAGSMVFGGGHVVLPLLEEPFRSSGWLDRDAVLSGYALAQSVPGPLFTMVSYLGAAMGASEGAATAAAGAALLVASVFLPGLLLVIATLPAWHRLRSVTGLRAALVGANCAVIGLLAATLVNDVLPGAAASEAGIPIAVVATLALAWLGRRAP
jgi:chromate transporter